MERLIGPGYGCMECGEVYGRHTKACSIPVARELEEAKANKRLGNAFLKAIKNNDGERIGKILRERHEEC